MQNRSENLKKPLIHQKVNPVSLVEVTADRSAFQGWKIKTLSEIHFPLTLETDEIVIDFGNHYTGYLLLNLKAPPNISPIPRQT